MLIGKKRKIPLSPALFLILFTSILWACSAVIRKYVLFSIDYWSLFVGAAVGELAVALCVISWSGNRKRLVRTFRALESKRKFLVIALLNLFLIFVAMITNMIAISLGPVSLVSAIGATKPLYVLGIILFLSIFRPRILKEEISKSIVSLKLFGILLIFVGIWFITVV